MNERPIIFSAPMVRALLAGTKTQTRRVVRPQPDAGDVAAFGNGKGTLRSPFGASGDRLRVRETWRPHSLYEDRLPRDMPASRVYYAADDAVAPPDARWRSPIHMPRWASRIMLEVTDVRVERLHAISEADAAAEGWPGLGSGKFDPDGHAARDWYAGQWERIHGAGAWASNPWVWALTFRRVEDDSPAR